MQKKKVFPSIDELISRLLGSRNIFITGRHAIAAVAGSFIEDFVSFVDGLDSFFYPINLCILTLQPLKEP